MDSNGDNQIKLDEIFNFDTGELLPNIEKTL